MSCLWVSFKRPGVRYENEMGVGKMDERGEE